MLKIRTLLWTGTEAGTGMKTGTGTRTDTGILTEIGNCLRTEAAWPVEWSSEERNRSLLLPRVLYLHGALLSLIARDKDSWLQSPTAPSSSATEHAAHRHTDTQTRRHTRPSLAVDQPPVPPPWLASTDIQKTLTIYVYCTLKLLCALRIKG